MVVMVAVVVVCARGSEWVVWQLRAREMPNSVVDGLIAGLLDYRVAASLDCLDCLGGRVACRGDSRSRVDAMQTWRCENSRSGRVVLCCNTLCLLACLLGAVP